LSRLTRLDAIGGLLSTFSTFDAKEIEQERRDVLEHRGVERVDELLPAPLAAHEARGLEDVEVMRHRALRQLERVRQLARGPRATLQELEHPAAARIGQRLEDLVRAHGG
jgi:hypothetical protein